MRMRRLFPLAVLALGAGAAGASAQTTISLEGVVRSDNGQPIPEAQVRVADPATGALRGARTNETGTFRVLGLAPGRYRVSVQRIGYTPAQELVDLLIGQRANLTFTLHEGATSLGTVAVSANVARSVEVQRTSVSAPVTHEQIEHLPTVDRNVMTLAATTPGIRSFAPQAGRSLPSAGSVPDLRFINFYLDGIELKSLFNGNLVGIPQTGAPIPQESIQEFRVFLNPYDAEYSHAGAYVLSAESNRGTNDTHGAVFAFYQGKQMTTRTAFQKTLPNFNREQIGFNLNGALKRDRLFYAVNYELTNNNNYIDVVPGRPAANPGLWDAYAGSFAAPQRNHTGFLRLTYTPSERQTLDAEWSTRYLTGQGNFGGIASQQAGITQKYFINVAQLRHRFLPTQNTMNELSLQVVQWHHNEDELVPGAQRSYPSITFGTATFPLVLNELHLRAIDRVTWTKDNFFGTHVFKGGAELSHISADQFSPNFQFGAFSYKTDTSSAPYQATIGVGFPDATSTADAKASLSGWVTGLYLNDEWRPVQPLTLNLGLRYDAELNTIDNNYTVPWASDPALANVAAVQPYLNRGNRKNDLNNISPRLSFSWDVFGDNRTFVRGGYGVIFDRVPSFIGFQERLGATWRTYTFQTSSMNVDSLRRVVASGTVKSTPNLVLVKDKMDTPENHQFSLGAGHQVSDAFAVNVDYLHQDVRHLYARLNLNYLDKSVTPAARHLTPAYGDIVVWDDFARAKFDGVVTSVAYQRPSLTATLSYTLGYYKADYDAVTAPAFPFRSSYNMQPTSGDERHRFVLSEVAHIPWGITLSSITTLASPRRIAATLGRDANLDNSLEDDFLPNGNPAGERTVPVPSTWSNWYRNIDVRLEKNFLQTGSMTYKLSAEVFNLLNTYNVAGYNGRMQDQAGNPLASFGQPNAAFGARRAQVGIRMDF